MFKNKFDYVLIPECRFPNEIQKMIDDGWNVMSVRVTRLDYKNQLTEDQQKHISETALDGYQFDYYIDSKSGIDNLRIEVKKMYRYMKLKDGEINS